jgi:hypothetical protein
MKNRRRRNRGLSIKAKKRKSLKASPKVGSDQSQWMQKAFDAGQIASEKIDVDDQTDVRKAVNRHWNQWMTAVVSKIWPWGLYAVLAGQYVRGFCLKAGMTTEEWVLTPTTKKVAVIVTVMNEENSISSVLNQLERLHIDELIVVVNGTIDSSFDKIRHHSSALIAHYPLPLGHDVGRAIGAKLAQSDIYLFLDGDFPINAEHLVPFIYEIDQGGDVVLNNISPYISLFKNHDSVTIFKEFLNLSLGRADLCANSMTAIPHALSRRAIELIGNENLAVPPKAQAKAIQLDLSILVSSISIDVISKNKHREENVGRMNQVSDLIIGDHLEALESVMGSTGARLFYPDVNRNRALCAINEH